ncbi:MAG: MBL fold metallo-hydrolase [Gammaproteobacteria bacterium]
MATLTFHGAAQRVTGSCYLIEAGGHRLLLECGQIQGENHNGSPPPFPFDPASIDAVVLSHAHLDHSGRIPELVRGGFSGPVFLTRASHALMELLLKDAAFLELKDTEWQNRKRQRAGLPPIQPDFTLDDVESALTLRQPQRYGARFEVLPGIECCFRDAGHILGSAIVELWVGKGPEQRKLVFSGDLGNHFSPLLRDPEIVHEADLLLLESTYGNRDHRPHSETVEEFAQALQDAADSGGNVLIPAFAVGRTQDLIYYLGDLFHEGRLPQQAVFLDSPMAIEASAIYSRFTELFNEDDPEFRHIMHRDWNQWLPVLQYSRTPEESMAINRIKGGAIIIAGSGMCTGGRIRHHLKHNLWRREAHVIIAGFQARGTPGRALIDGTRSLRLLGEEIAVRATIHTLGGFSAHAGQSQLIQWARHFKARPPRLFLIHGEHDNMVALQQQLIARLGWNSSIPTQGETVTL